MPIKSRSDIIYYDYFYKERVVRYIYCDDLGKYSMTTKPVKDLKLGIAPTDLNAMANVVIRAIQELKPSDAINELFNRRHVIKTKPVRNIYSWSETSKEWGHYQQQTYEHRPFLEALFFYDLTRFKQLIDEILIVSKQIPHGNRHAMQYVRNICTYFFSSLEATELNNPFFLQWNPSTNIKLEQQLTTLENIGKTLKLSSDPQAKKRGELAESLAASLKSKIHSKHFNKKNPFYDIEVLQFKCEILNVLHAHDEIFSQECNWKKFAVNTATLLCFAGLANFTKYVFTTNGFFYNKTKIQNSVSEIQEALGLDTEEVPQRLSLG